MSDSHIAQIEAGDSASLEAYARLFVALEREPRLSGVDRPEGGLTSSLVLVDPGPNVREAFRLGELAPATRPRHRDYASAAAALRT